MTSRGVERRFARGDLAGNKVVNLALTVVLVVSAFLGLTGVMVAERAWGGVDKLFVQAKPPHFLQMHVGDYDESAIADFARENPQVKAWFIQDMVGYSSEEIAPLTGSAMDNLFVTQNLEFDHLLGPDGGVPQPAPGQVYAPITYESSLIPGEKLAVRTNHGIHELTVAGFVRDAQMASSLSSSARFVVHPRDLAALKDGGREEIIVEFLLHDERDASSLKAAYEADPRMPANGQAVTYDMIRLVNALSEGLLAVGLVLISLLFVLIAFLAQRFVVASTLNEQVRAIGAMKAIGIPTRDIARLFMAKYVVIGGLAGLLGLLVAVCVVPVIVRGAGSVLVPAAALGVFYLIILGMCWWNMRAVKKVEPVPAMVHGQLPGRGRAKATLAPIISTRSPCLADMSLALADVSRSYRTWLMVPLTMMLASLAVILPANVAATFASPTFTSYLGTPLSDVRVDIQFVDNAAELVPLVRDEVVVTEEYGLVTLTGPTPEGPRSVRAAVGDFSATTQHFMHGSAPTDGEVALSVLAAQQYGVDLGSTVSLGGEDYHVSGIYQDVTGGGITARLSDPVPEDSDSYVFYLQVDSAQVSEVVARLNELHPDIHAAAMEAFTQETTANITRALNTATFMAGFLALCIVLFILALFLQLRIAAEKREIAIRCAIGFTPRGIGAAYMSKVVLGAAIGVLLGAVLAIILGEPLLSGLLSATGLGISEFTLVPNTLLSYAVIPAVLLLAAFAAAWLAVRPLHHHDLSFWLKG